MLNVREFALVVAIVFAFSSWFLDPQLLFAAVDAFR